MTNEQEITPASQPEKKYRSAWIDVARVIAAFLIICVHIPNFPKWVYDWSLFGRTPLFFVLAGYFCSFELPYGKMFHKVIWLFIPLLIWNIIAILTGYGDAIGFSLKSLTGIGEFHIAPADGPLWFLFYIILFTLCVPFFRLLKEYKIIVFCVLCIFWSILGIAESGSQNLSIEFFFKNIVYFYIGLCLSCFKICQVENELIEHNRYIVIIVLALIVSWYSGTAVAWYNNIVSIFSCLLGASAIISVAAFIDRQWPKISHFLSQYVAPSCFFIFAFHSLFIHFLQLKEPQIIKSNVVYIVPILIVFISALFYNLFNKYCPLVLCLIAHKQPKWKGQSGGLSKIKDVVWSFVAVGFCGFVFFSTNQSSQQCYNDIFSKKQNNIVYLSAEKMNQIPIVNNELEKNFILSLEKECDIFQFSVKANKYVRIIIQYDIIENNKFDEVNKFDGMELCFFLYSPRRGIKTYSLRFPIKEEKIFVRVKMRIECPDQDTKIVFMDPIPELVNSDRVMYLTEEVSQFPEHLEMSEVPVLTDEISNMKVLEKLGNGLKLESLTNDPLIVLPGTIRTDADGMARLAMDWESSKETSAELYYGEHNAFGESRKVTMPSRQGRNRMFVRMIGKPHTEYNIRWDPAIEAGVTTTLHSIRQVKEGEWNYETVSEFPKEEVGQAFTVDEQRISGTRIVTRDSDRLQVESQTNDPILPLNPVIKMDESGKVRMAIDWNSSRKGMAELFYQSRNDKKALKVVFHALTERHTAIVTLEGEPGEEYELRLDPTTEPGVTTTIYSMGILKPKILDNQQP